MQVNTDKCPLAWQPPFYFPGPKSHKHKRQFSRISDQDPYRACLVDLHIEGSSTDMLDQEIQDR